MGRALQPGVDKIKEGWVKDRVKEMLKPFPNLHWDMPPASEFGVAGRHDFIICQRGLFWTVETKAGRNKPTDLQIGYAKDIKEAGGLSIWVNEFNYSVVGVVAAFIHRKGYLPTTFGGPITPGLFDVST